MKISIPTFRGRAPRVSDRALSDGYGSIADSPRLLSGDLESWRERTQSALLPKGPSINTVYRLASRTGDQTPYWLHWTPAELAVGAANVDVALGPEPADTDVATYFTGTTLGPRYTTKFLATDVSQQGGSPPGGYPYASRSLGINPPTVAPTIVQTLPVLAENQVSYSEPGASTSNLQYIRTGGPYGGISVTTDTDPSAPASSLETPRIFVNWRNGGGALVLWNEAYDLANSNAITFSCNLDTNPPSGSGNSSEGDMSVVLFASDSGVGARVLLAYKSAGRARYLDTAGNNTPITFESSPGVPLNIDGNLPITVIVTGTKNTPATGSAVVTWTLTIELREYGTNTLLSTLTGMTATVAGDLIGIIGTSGAGGNNTIGYFNGLSLTTTLAPDAQPVPILTSYVYTLVSDLGWESAPSPVSDTVTVDNGITNTVTIPAQVEPNVVAVRIYRAAIGAADADFLFVAEVAPPYPAVYVDTTPSERLGEALITELFDLPPFNLRGLLALPGGSLVGFAGNELCFSEPEYPYAWPRDYRLPTDYNIVALGAINSAVVVLTEAFVYIASGNAPGDYAMEKLEYPQGCVSKRSVAYASGAGVLYASPDGLYSVTGSGAPQNTTELLFSRREWQALNPSTIIGIAHDDRYFGFYDATPIGGIKGGFILDFRQPGGFGLIDIPDHATAVYADPITDVLYFVADDGLLEGASAAGLLRFTAATYSGAPGSTINAVVERVGGSDGAVSASYATADGVAIGSEFGTTGSDYFDNAGTVNFADGETSKIIPIGTVVPNYDAEVAQGSPWAYWKFNEASGTTVLDSSGNARNLTVAAGTLERSQDTLNATASVSTRIGTGDRVERVSTGLVGHIDIAVEGWFQSTSAAGTAKTLFSVGGVTADASANTNWQFRPAIEANGSPSIFWEYNVGVNENIGFPEFQTTVNDFLISGTPFYFVFGRRAALNQVYCRINDLPVVTKTYANPPTGGSTTVAGVGNQQSNDLPANGRFSHVAVYLTPVEPNRYARWRLNAERNLLLSLSNATGGAAIGSPAAANVVVQA